jgi:hypothetical protein
MGLRLSDQSACVGSLAKRRTHRGFERFITDFTDTEW